ncbi:MAG: sulfatase-like hydrolase/transferase [Myxococcota bacterium]
MTTRRRFLQGLATVAACDPSRDAEPGFSEPLEGGERSGLYQDSRPDILFISIDDLNDWPTPFEGPKPTIDPQAVSTPNMDLLAQMGTVFQRAYCAAPMCGPSRSATLTGLPPHVSGVTQQENIMVPKAKFGPLLQAPTTTLPRLLNEAGYRTYGAGKVFHGGFGGSDRPFADCEAVPEDASYDSCAWDHYEFLNKFVPEGACLPDPGNDDISDSSRPCSEPFDPSTSMLPDARVARYGIERLETESTDEPMFLALGFFKPHKEWEAPQEFYDLYGDDVLAPLDSAVEKADQDDLTFTGCITIRDSRNSPPDSTWDTATRTAIRGYLACVSYVDALLGAVVDAAIARPRRTIIVVWSDHGYFMGEKRGWKKPSLYERATRVPLFIVDTDNPVPQSTYGMASLMDLFPTVLDYASVADPLQYGVSLRPLVEDAAGPWYQTSVVSTFNFQTDHQRRADLTFNDDVTRCMSEQQVSACGPYIRACGSYPSRLAGASFALRTERPGERFRYISYFPAPGFEPPAGSLTTEELYDLEADPNERTNLIEAGLTPELASTLGKLQKELADKLS